MALKSRNKVNANFSMSSMTDIVFLLLIFFMVTSTLIAPNALKLLLPKSSNQTAANPITSVSIDKHYNFYIETTPTPFSKLEGKLQRMLAKHEDPTISLHVDKSVPMEQVVKVMNIAKNNKYKLILATSAK
ncbi:biopolymer transporter ExbD [Ancylomarina salipaludis]|uniref:Biopolymer transporter ExbD n=1 Tax=Ancylomarina salipaludis TaxID=2501299 RepID=A0A4Q1JQ08_9BACT|nr:biopolymer transporter ExbD [Ancylomarina salipaludis]RXQ97504.1 biopolymer transporter ExbD [Ancylomarina salipaludis]